MSLIEIFLALLWLICVALLIHSHFWHRQVQAEKAQGSAQFSEEE
jgi:cell division protein FtsL